MIIKAAVEGCWLLLENMHLVTDWIPVIQKFMQAMYKEDLLNTFITHNENSDDDSSAHNMLGSGSESKLPSLNGKKIHPNFRLFLSCMPVKEIPVSFLQDCVKIILQPAEGISQNALKILNSVSFDFL
jgi:hypothetical protein